MYNNAGFAGGTLAATGFIYNGMWMFLAAFALFAMFLAVGRILPKDGM